VGWGLDWINLAQKTDRSVLLSAAEEQVAFQKRPCSMQLVIFFYCAFRELFLYIKRTDVRSKKALCGFHKLSCQTVRCMNLPDWRYNAGGQFGKILRYLAFRISFE